LVARRLDEVGCAAGANAGRDTTNCRDEEEEGKKRPVLLLDRRHGFLTNYFPSSPVSLVI
jgi:hypothetical protein